MILCFVFFFFFPFLLIILQPFRFRLGISVLDLHFTDLHCELSNVRDIGKGVYLGWSIDAGHENQSSQITVQRW